MTILIYLTIGVGAGVLAGLFGVGGGLVIVPALVIALRYGQIEAAGTSLVALLAPVGIGGVYAFYHAGKISPENIKAGIMIACGMVVGSFFGAKMSLALPEYMMKRAFCIFIVAVAIRMWLQTVGD